MCFSNEDATITDSLSRPLSMENISESLLGDKCDYWLADKYKNLNPSNYNFIAMQWNIQSLMSNIGELNLLLNKLELRNSPVDIILLCETFLNKSTEKLINLPQYCLYSNHRKDHKGGGIAILVSEGITHKRCKDLEVMVEKEVEATYIEMTSKNGKHIILGSIYKSPNTSEKKLKDHITEVLTILKNEKGNKELVLGMDHNLDLLKEHEHHKMQQFLDLMLELELTPTIMRPTRITQSSATLIDNMFISSVLQRPFDSLILLEDTSDHMPSLVLMKQTKLRDKKPLGFKSRSLNEVKLEHIKNDLKIKDWNGMLRNDSVDENFDQFCDVVSETMDKFTPLKEVNISWR